MRKILLFSVFLTFSLVNYAAEKDELVITNFHQIDGVDYIIRRHKGEDGSIAFSCQINNLFFGYLGIKFVISQKKD